MKQILSSLALCIGVSSAPAAIEILYLAPTDTAPVLGSISTDSEAFRSARPVEGEENWMEVVREDYYSGFIARDSLDGAGEVEIGTALLLTPSKQGKVLTTIEEGDEVTVNLVDDWTEVTVFKKIPGYFQPMDEESAEATRRAAPAPPARLSYAEDPLLTRVRGTRYTPPPVSNPSGVTDQPVANRGTTLTAEPMTGFEEVDSLNPAFGRTAPDGTNRGFSLGPGSTPVPAATAADGSSTFRSGSMQDPLSVARIPRATTEDTDPMIEAPTQSETVDRIEETEAEEIETPAVEDRMSDLEQQMAAIEEGAPGEEASDDIERAEEEQEAAVETVEEPIPAPAGETDESAEVIPLAPAASAAASAASAAAAGAPGTEAAEEPIAGETPVEILAVEEDVEVSEDVAEAVVPGITQPALEDEPPLIPPTDTNRTYIGRLQRTTAGFFGKKPPQRFELVNYRGDRIAFVDISNVPMSSEEKFVDRIVRVYGVMLPSPDEDVLMIEASNITLR